MKKLFILLAASLVALPVFAQHVASPSSIYTSSDGVVSIGSLNHMTWGYDFVKSDAFTPKGGGEFAFNVLGLSIYPSEYFGIETGLDCKWQYFNTKESCFYLQSSDNVPQVYDSWTVEGGSDWKKSSLGVFSLSIPVVAKVYMGKFWIGGGAEANFNLSAYTDCSFKKGNTTTTVSQNKGKLNLFTYDFVGLVGYSDAAVFAKFYPKNSSFVPEGGVKLNYWTLGIAFFL